MSDEIPSLSEFPYQLPITTRWMDNDLYGHVNNVTYYSYFDTVANSFLIERGGLDIHAAEIIGVVVESKCRYLSSIAYPDKIVGAMRVEYLGNSSVRYGIGIFREGEEQPSALGYFTHVFVERMEMTSVPIPDPIRDALTQIRIV